MRHFYADDGRILTPPQELQPQLKDSFQAFSELLGLIRFFYIADEIWDGKSSLVFNSRGEKLAAILLNDGFFIVHIGEEKIVVIDETALDSVLEKLEETASPDSCRPNEQLLIPLNDPNQFPCGRRCDLCLGSKKSDERNYSQSENFGYMNWVCYHNCLPGIEVTRWDGVFNCPGCVEMRKTKDCKYFPCPAKKAYSNCVECGEYHSCKIFSDCHEPCQCNLGITAEEVTNLVIPYASKERLDILSLTCSRTVDNSLSRFFAKYRNGRSAVNS